MTTHNPSLSVAPRAISRSHVLVVSGVLVTFFATLTFLGANIVIPLVPVPITMQTLFVLLAGAIIGNGRGALSQALRTLGSQMPAMPK